MLDQLRNFIDLSRENLKNASTAKEKKKAQEDLDNYQIMYDYWESQLKNLRGHHA